MPTEYLADGRYIYRTEGLAPIMVYPPDWRPETAEEAAATVLVESAAGMAVAASAHFDPNATSGAQIPHTDEA